MKTTGSYHQQRLWFIDFFEKDYLYDGSPVYHNIPLYMPLEVQLTEENLHHVLSKLIARHEVLRTQLVQNDGQVSQKVVPLTEAYLDTICSEEKGLFDKLTTLREKSLDFGCLLRTYFEITETGTQLFFVFHHAIMDRYSIGKVREELEELILQPNAIHEDTASFKDFSNWQNSLTKDDLEPLLFYWKSKLKNLQVLYFATDMEREQVHKYQSQNAHFTLAKAEIISFCEEKQCSPRVLFLAAFKMALARLTGLNDIVVGTFFDLRNRDGKTLMGPVENLVVLRSLLRMDDTLWETNELVQDVWNEAETYKTMPFDRLVNELNPKKDMSRTALFDVLYAYELVLDSAEGSMDWNEGWGKYDFNLLVTEHANEFEIILNYNGLYFYRETAQSLLDLTLRFAETTIHNSTKKLGEIELITSEEKKGFIHPTKLPIEKGAATLVSLFAEQVEKNGDRIGVNSEERSLTYKEIDQKSNRLAHVLLKEYKLQLEDKVAVVLSNPEQIVIALLAILKAGAAYVPIHPNYPEARQEFMMEDSGCSLRMDEQLLLQLAAPMEAANPTLPKKKITPQNLAYIIYTSGTTGQPKGVLIEHGNVVQLLESCYGEMDFSETDGWLFFHSHCFDFSVWEIFGCLLSGGHLAVMMGDEARNPEALAVLMNTFKTTIFNQTPSAFYNFIDFGFEVPSLRYVIFGGEALNPFRLKSWSEQHPEVSLVNMYGITETTVHVTFKELEEKDFDMAQSNIGKPLSFAECYVLDAQKQLLPFGRPGELYVTGAGVARGYLNRPELTAERFLESPFQLHEKMYRTGDLVRYLKYGEMEYLGRVDDQVKIRGYRIELDEIKRQLETLSGVSQCVVSIFEMQDGDKSIVAYVSVAETLTVAEIKSYIATKVPEYMVPAFIVLLDNIPMNANGKIDKSNLPSPLSSASQNSLEIIAPASTEEITLFEIWKELLHIDAFGITHNFFELGGHSLKATRLIAAIQKTFGVKIKLRDIFENPSIQSQVRLIDKSEKESLVPIERVAEMESYPVSNGQHRLWSASKIDGGSVAFNMPSWLLLDGDYDLSSFTRAITAVIDRHEVLRTVFKQDDSGEVRQWIKDSSDLNFTIDYQDFTTSDKAQELANDYIATDSYKLFDLEKGPLMRASLLKIGAEQYLFYYNMHHIISDGWSMEVLSKDVFAYYKGYQDGSAAGLPQLGIQYKDYAAWQRSQMDGLQFEEHKRYWLDRLEGELPIVDLPSSQSRPKIKTYSGASLQGYLDPSLTKGLNDYVHSHGGSLFTGLLSLLNLVLHKYTSLDDIVIGSPVSGRSHGDLSDQIGFYLNMLALRNSIDLQESFEAFYKRINDNTLEAYDHQMYPFDRLVEELGHSHGVSRSAVFDVLLDLHTQDEHSPTLSLDANPLDGLVYREDEVSKLDMEIIFGQQSEYLSFYIRYNKDVYQREMVEGMMKHFKGLLSLVLETPEKPINEINFLSEAEQNRLLHDFNQTQVAVSDKKTVLDLFAKQVKKTPEATALVFEQRLISYKELDELSNQLARCLMSQHDISKESIVGLQLDRSHWVLVSVLGVLKSGASYVPIDPELPTQRKAHIADDTTMTLLITETSYMFDTEYYQGDLFAIDVEFTPSDFSSEDLDVAITPQSLAYIIYTSGSTGNPKGVMIEHASLVNYLEWCKSYYLSHSEGACHFGLFTSLSFDLTVTSLFLPLVSGHSLHIIPPVDNVADALQKYLQGDISCIKLTPSHISLLKDMQIEDSSLKMAIVGGEALQSHQIDILRGINPEMKIYNEYGPTEATVGCITHQISHNENTILIGKPIFNTQIYLLDASNQLQAEGVIGEICIGGNGLARGYLNSPELTSEKFIDNPYKEGDRIYKSGDLGKWLPDGSLVYIGRKDDQVKIRGHRVELGEIAYHLQEKQDIEEAVVVTQPTDDGTQELVAYIVSNKEHTTLELRDYLQDKVTDYMMPSYFVPLEHIPLTHNGKVDHQSLPSPEGMSTQSGIEYLAPRNEIEQQLVDIWEELLQKEPIGVKDDFFALGGDSLKALKLISMVQKEFDFKIEFQEVYGQPNISYLANFIESFQILNNQEEDGFGDGNELVF